MPLRRLVLSALIAASSGLAAQSVALSGNTETLVGYSLPGVTVSLANAGISVVSVNRGAWSLSGEVGIASRPGVPRQAVTRNLALENGHLVMRFEGRSLLGRRWGGVSEGVGHSGAVAPVGGRAATDSVVIDTLLYRWKNTVVARKPLTSYVGSGLEQSIDTGDVNEAGVVPGPSGAKAVHPLSWEQFRTLASAMKYIQARNRTFLMGVKDSLVQDDGAAKRHAVSFSYDYWMDSVETRTQDFAEVMNWAKNQGLIKITTVASDGRRDAWTPTYRHLFPLIPIVANNSTEQMDIDGKTGTIVPSSGQAYPMDETNWYGAAYYANLKSLKAGLEPVYDTATWQADFGKNGYRLPTEAEWEYASRGGVRTEYLWGNVWDATKAGQVGNNSGSLWPVAFLRPNGYGLYDMFGNASENVNDWFAPFTGEAVIDPIGSSQGNRKVYKAPGAGQFAGRPGYRLGSASESKGGFRLVLPIH